MCCDAGYLDDIITDQSVYFKTKMVEEVREMSKSQTGRERCGLLRKRAMSRRRGGEEERKEAETMKGGIESTELPSAVNLSI